MDNDMVIYTMLDYIFFTFQLTSTEKNLLIDISIVNLVEKNFNQF